MRKMPRKCSPMAMMNSPAIGVMIGNACRNACPNAVAVAPKVTNTSEKPRMKNTEVKTLFRQITPAVAPAARN
jgi:hypothetical protein